MTTEPDRRSTPATDRIALASLRGILDRPAYTEGEAAHITAPLTDLCASPGGARDRQLLMGCAVTVVERRNEWAFVQDQNLYCGWVTQSALGTGIADPTHRVAVPATQVYPSANFKQRAIATLSLGARLTVKRTDGNWAELTSGGFVPAIHLDDQPATDAATVASLLVGTPYVWGGNSRDGIDCSGLVQLALNACGQICPGDSDQQRGLGAEAGTNPRRGDLFFWPGHVAVALDDRDMIHATAFGMAVITEPIASARARIEADEKTPLLTIRRL